MKILTIPVTSFEQNARLVIDDESKSAALIDPGGDVETIIGTINDEGATVEALLLTHAHLDHAGGIKRTLRLLSETQETKPVFMAHRDEQFLRAGVSGQAQIFGLSPLDYEDCPEPDRYLQDGDKIKIGSIELSVLFTPGHSPGHLAYYIAGKKPVVFTGDALFKGSIGRTDLPGGNARLLIKSIHEKLLTLPDHTLVMPGHGPDTNIGMEKLKNPFLAKQDI